MVINVYSLLFVVLIFTAVKKLKPCGSHSSPIFHTNFRYSIKVQGDDGILYPPRQ